MSFVSDVVPAGRGSSATNAPPTLAASTATATARHGNASATPTGAASSVTKVGAVRSHLQWMYEIIV